MRVKGASETVAEKKVEYKSVDDIHDCNDLEVLYYIDYEGAGGSYVFKYESGGLIFKIQLDTDLHENCYVNLTTVKYGFADLKGMNIYKYISCLKQVLECLQENGVKIREFRFEHVASFLTSEQVDIMLDYLIKKGKYKSGQDYEPEDLPEDFLKASEKDTDLDNEQLLLKEYLNRIFGDYDFRKKVEDESRQKRFELFGFAISRIFRGAKARIDDSLKPNIVVRFV